MRPCRICQQKGMDSMVKEFKMSQERYDELKKELQNHVKKTTAPYKYPRIVEFVDELPKTISGKIRRVELREKDKAAMEKK